jgi:transcriptional regulator with XRE-family HTH domain
MKRTKAARAFVVAVGQKVKRARERRQLSQAALGAKLDGDHSLVSRIESGKKDLRLSGLHEVSRALETTPRDLVDVDVPRPRQSAGDSTQG